ncbi:reverse transcriptase domain-containing protein [Tanacetum coccineum]|uniref:Reverse transcriptase domain-containing protein n=1 Tax=Tanacetum coccineum TaxID=301880 RepID=A0ABQ4WS32_9ASTR
MIGSTLTEEGRNKLCNLLQRNLDIIAWKPADMTGVPRHIAKHRLNMREGCSPIRNAGERLVDKAFHKHIGRNMEVYVDDLVHLIPAREAKQMPVYFVSRALRGPKLNYTSMEKLLLALVHASKRVKTYFQAHPIIVITDQLIQHVLSRPKVAGRLQKWSIELGEHAIHYRPRVSVKGQILADFIVERPEEDSPDTPMEVTYVPKEADLIRYLEKVKPLPAASRRSQSDKSLEARTKKQTH